MASNDGSVFRVVRRRARPGCEAAYEALIEGMLRDASRFQGYLSAQLIPPAGPDGEYQIVQRFATAQDLARWNDSSERATWHARLRPVAEGDPDYRILSGLDAWFAPTLIAASAPPSRWRMTVEAGWVFFPRWPCCYGLSRPSSPPCPFCCARPCLPAWWRLPCPIW